MNVRPLVFALMLCPTLLLAAEPAAVERDEASVSDQLEPEQLLQAGDAKADEAEYAAALLLYKQAYERLVPQMRGLKFSQPVEPRFMTRDELKKYMVQELEEEISAEELVLLDRSLKAFGFAPMSLDAKATMLNLITEEVAGFYNPRSKEIFLIQEAEEPEPQGFFARLFGPPPAFDKEAQKTTLAHEMTHALADQHFDLHRLDEAIEDDDDMSLALSALIEGEATVLMIGDMMRDGDDISAVLEMPPSRAEWMFRLMNWTIPFSGGKTLTQAPAIFRKTLMFPYHRGTVFVLTLTNRDGWSAVNRAFGDPPTSTEQIMHPEKYLPPRDEPTALQLPDLQDELAEDWKRLGENTLGEYQILVLLLGVPGGARGSEGWDGDRYAIYEKGEQRLGLVWLSTWDSEQDAAEFAEAYRHYRSSDAAEAHSESQDEQSRTNSGGESETSTTDVSKIQAVWRQQRDGRIDHVEVRGADVAVLEGFSEAETDRLLPRLFQATRSEKKFRLPPAPAADSQDAGEKK